MPGGGGGEGGRGAGPLWWGPGGRAEEAGPGGRGGGRPRRRAARAMDEAALQTYRAQLQQVERALGAGRDSPEEADLRQLQRDLRELIELTEAGLASDGPGAPPEPPAAAASPAPAPAEELSGTKVNAPFYSAWGSAEYHNAMVVGTEEARGGAARVRVLCLCPTRAALKPCPFFLEGRCRFTERCRFSHGQVVPVDELRPFQDPDLSSLQVGSACLAKHQDGLWHPARITDVDSGYYTVKFDSLLLKEAVVEGDGVLPPLHTEATESSDSESSDTDGASYARVVEPSAVDTGTCSSAFAGWEAHTRAIGSRLLAKMGYEFGKGLGRNLEGRVEPVQAVVLPRGKSLDQCAQILQKRAQGDGAGASRAPRSRGRGGGPGAAPPPRSVFDFLNEKLQGQAPGAPEAEVAPSRRGKDMYHASKSAKQALSLRLLQTEEKIERTQRDIRAIQEALARNTGRYSVAAAQLEEKLAGAQRRLGQLRAQEAGLQRAQSKADTHKKMTEF